MTEKWPDIKIPIDFARIAKFIENTSECEKNIKDGYLIHTCPELRGLKEKIEEKDR